MYLLGRIDSPSGVAANNRTGGASSAALFTIGSAFRDVYLVPDSTGTQFEFGVATGFNTSPTRAAWLAGPNVVNGPYRMVGEIKVISIVKIDGGGSVKVYAGPGK